MSHDGLKLWNKKLEKIMGKPISGAAKLYNKCMLEFLENEAEAVSRKDPESQVSRIYDEFGEFVGNYAEVKGVTYLDLLVRMVTIAGRNDEDNNARRMLESLLKENNIDFPKYLTTTKEVPYCSAKELECEDNLASLQKRYDRLQKKYRKHRLLLKENNIEVPKYVGIKEED